MTEVAARVVLDLLDFLDLKPVGRRDVLALVRRQIETEGGNASDLADDALTRRGHRVSWNSFAVLVELWSTTLGGSDAEREFALRGFTVQRGRWTKILPYVVGLVTSPMQLYLLSARVGPMNFPGIKFAQEVLRDGRYALTVNLQPDERDAPAFFRLSGFNFVYLARVLGCDDAIVETEIGQRRARYVVTPPPSRSLLARALRHARGIFAMHALVAQLGEREDTLRQSYGRLRDAHAELEKRISERTRALEAAASTMTEVERIAQVGSWNFDLASGTSDLSEEGRRIFGLPPGPGQVPRSVFTSRVSPASAAAVAAAISRCLEAGQPIDVEHEIMAADGALAYVHVRGALYRDALGKPERIIGTLQDITWRKRYERSLLEARDLADQANRMKSVFLANISHEIRTPMTAVLGFADLIVDPAVAAGTRAGYVARMQQNGRHLLALIDDVLDLSSIEAGRLTITTATIVPATEIAQVVESLGQQAAAKRLALDLRLGSDLPAAMETDPVRFRQILLNVVANAIKYTDHGRVELRVQRASHGGRPALEAQVEDTGIGIPPELQHLLFQPFSQAVDGAGPRRGGVGLGLALTRRLAQALGGDVRLVASRPGAGSTFSIVLPLKRGP